MDSEEDDWKCKWKYQAKAINYEIYVNMQIVFIEIDSSPIVSLIYHILDHWFTFQVLPRLLATCDSMLYQSLICHIQTVFVKELEHLKEVVMKNKLKEYENRFSKK